MEKLNANSTLVAVPSLSLVKQTLEVYLKQVVAKNKTVKWLCICSDEGIGKSDDIVTHTRDLPVPCTTDPDYIKKWLKDNKNENIIIFTTYQSGRLIAEASKSLKFTFDLGIYDEAHKTVGKNENLFSYLLFEQNISVKHRIFMTATERFYRGVRDDVLSMDDTDDYGDVFCHMSFKEAIEEDLLTDYKIITIEVKKEEIAAFIKDNNLVKSNDKWGDEKEARSLASMIALRKAMKRFPIKNAVSFHSTIKRAIRNKEVQKHITDSYNFKPIDTYHVSGRLPTTKRNAVVQEFAKSDRALITNSRCLTEGVDVPNIDCIVFADPRKSKVDIVQALGRALRKKEGKDFGYVVLPVIYDHISHEIDNENFQEILNVVRGLAANDERIIEEFKDKSQNSGKVTGAREEIFRIDPELLEESELVSNLSIKLWDKLSRFNWMPFVEAREFTRSLSLMSGSQWRDYITSSDRRIDLPVFPHRVYKNTGWKSWGDWLGTGTIATQDRSYYPFEKARAIVRKQKLKGQQDWKVYSKTKRPDFIPGAPQIKYKNKGWKNWSDWLGYTGYIRGEWLEYEKAMEFAQKLNFKNQKEWFKYAKSSKKPNDIPRSPMAVYKDNGWISWSSFLGHKSIYDSSTKVFLSFDEARVKARKLKLNSENEWREYCKSGRRPLNIPSNPSKKYKNNWISMSDFLGYKGAYTGEYLSFKEAKKFVRKLKLKSAKQWSEYVNSGRKPENIPNYPKGVYLNKGWEGIGDWLGTGRISNKKREYRSFNEARDFVRKLNLKSQAEWRGFIKSKKRPLDIPSAPNRVYKNKGWLSLQDWLGTIEGHTGEYLSFVESRSYIRGLGLKSTTEWYKFSASKERPSHIPVNPQRMYKSNWLSFPDWIGTKPGFDGKCLSFEEAKSFAKSLKIEKRIQWVKYYNENKQDLYNVPYNPITKYKTEWKGWDDFLGKE